MTAEAKAAAVELLAQEASENIFGQPNPTRSNRETNSKKVAAVADSLPSEPVCTRV